MKISLLYSLSLATSLVPLATASASKSNTIHARSDLRQAHKQETRFIRSRRSPSVSVLRRTSPASNVTEDASSSQDASAMDMAMTPQATPAKDDLSNPMMQMEPSSGVDASMGKENKDDKNKMDNGNKAMDNGDKQKNIGMKDQGMGKNKSDGMGKMQDMNDNKDKMGMGGSNNDKGNMMDSSKDGKMTDNQMDGSMNDNNMKDDKMKMGSGHGKEKSRMDDMQHASSTDKGMVQTTSTTETMASTSAAESTSTVSADSSAATSTSSASNATSSDIGDMIVMSSASAASSGPVEMAVMPSATIDSTMTQDTSSASTAEATSTSDSANYMTATASSANATSTSCDSATSEASATSSADTAEATASPAYPMYNADSASMAASATESLAQNYAAPSDSASSAGTMASVTSSAEYATASSSAGSMPPESTASSSSSDSTSSMAMMESGASSYMAGAAGSASPPPAAAAPPASAADCQASAGSAETDLLVLNFANTLERVVFIACTWTFQLTCPSRKLETSFYVQGLATFSQSDMEKAGLSANQAQIIVESLTVIAGDEDTHSKALTLTISALGSTAIDVCKFDFTATLTDPVTFLATARALENVGISAYAGGAGLVSSKSILTAAAQILSIESRHQTVLNMLNAGSIIPQAFDMALLPQQVLALAGGFLTGCKAEDLGLTSNAPLSIRKRKDSSTSFASGDLLAFTSTVQADSKSTFCAMLVGGAAETINFPLEQCVIPDGIDGPVYIFLTSSDKPLAADINVQDTSTTIAGPGLIFVEGSSSLLQDTFTIQSGKYEVTKNGKKRKSMASSDMGYVNLMVQTNQVTGNATEWWANHRIAIE